MFRTVDEKIEMLQHRRSIVLLEIETYEKQANVRNRKLRNRALDVLTTLHLEMYEIERAMNRLKLRQLARARFRIIW